MARSNNPRCERKDCDESDGTGPGLERRRPCGWSGGKPRGRVERRHREGREPHSGTLVDTVDPFEGRSSEEGHWWGSRAETTVGTPDGCRDEDDETPWRAVVVER